MAFTITFAKYYHLAWTPAMWCPPTQFIGCIIFLPLWNTASFYRVTFFQAKKISSVICPPPWGLLSMGNCRETRCSHFVSGPASLTLRRVDWRTFKFHIARYREFDSISPIQRIIMHGCIDLFIIPFSWCCIERPLPSNRLSQKYDLNPSTRIWMGRRVWWCAFDMLAFLSCDPYSPSLLRSFSMTLAHS